MEYMKGTLGLLVAILIMGTSMNAFGFLGFGGTSWKEEVLLHDGSKIVVERSLARGGRREIGQRPPPKEESLSFTMPGTGQKVTWEDKFSEDIGSSNFIPMLLDMRDGVAYLVVSPMGCLSYNKWGRPNPPYVIFRYHNKEWKRITLQELPAEFKTPNLVISSPDDSVKQTGLNPIPAEKVQQLNEGFKQSEFKTILREPVKGGKGITSCEELVLYKGSWIMPNDPIVRDILDRRSK